MTPEEFHAAIREEQASTDAYVVSGFIVPMRDETGATLYDRIKVIVEIIDDDKQLVHGGWIHPRDPIGELDVGIVSDAVGMAYLRAIAQQSTATS